MVNYKYIRLLVKDFWIAPFLYNFIGNCCVILFCTKYRLPYPFLCASLKYLTIFQYVLIKRLACVLHITQIGEVMTLIKQKIEPEVCTYFDPHTNIFMIEVFLPNALKENIYIKVKRDALLIKANSDNINYAKYIYLSRTIAQNLVRASYKNGILHITAPIQA